jgi:outer membrane protein TolC
MFNRIPAKTISLDQIGWPYESNSRALNEVDVMISAHPRMATLDAALSRAQNRKRLAINETLPKLDLEMKVAKGLGRGDPWLSDEETVIGVAFAMPLGQRAAKARQRAEEAAITSLEYESIALERELRRDVDMGRAQLSYQRDIVALAKKMEAASEHLLSQETKRFREGSSDQFVLLSREKAFLEAQLTATAAKYELRRQELTLFASLAQLNFE